MTTQQDLLPTFAPSEQDMINSALAQPLERKIERAIMLLKHWEPAALKLDPRGYWVADSFGKDSDCIVELAKMAGVAHHCEHNLTTLDAPELIAFGRKTRPGTHINKKDISLLARMVQKSIPPTRVIRWCCAEYKEFSGSEFAKVVGVRIEESASRALAWKEFVRRRDQKTLSFVVVPICYWTEKDVWEFHRIRNMPHCCLYDEGFSRLGCIGCPMAGPTGQKRAFARWPQYEKMWKRAFEKTWDRWYGVPTKTGKVRNFESFGNPNKWYDWWRSGVGQGDGPACQGAELFAANELGDEGAQDE